MIPVKLTVQNFLSYTDPAPLEFGAFNVACLVGDNGAGKSALLDAVTFALFGRARGCEDGRNQERLIHDRADDTTVDLEFRLNDSLFRITRSRNRKGKGDLRFLVSDGGDWRNIAGETMRETEERIASTLRMDYRTFTASAFFVQGRAEDFLARMRPDERKDVFARLLDLGVYERLEEAARSRAREAEVRRAEHARRAEALSAATDDVKSVETLLAEARKLAEDAAGAAREASVIVDRARAEVTELEKTDARREAEHAALRELGSRIEQLSHLVRERKGESKELDKLLARADEIRSALEELDRLSAEEEDARERQRRVFELHKRRTAVAERLEAERRTISSRVADRRSQIQTRERELKDLSSVTTALAKIEKTLEGSGDPQAAIDEVQRTADEQRAIEARTDEQLRAIDTTSTELQEKAAVLRKGKGECPVCGSALDADHRQRAEKALKDQAAALTKQRADVRAQHETVRKEAARCSEELRRLRSTAKDHEKLLSERSAMLARLEREPALNDELASLREADRIDAAALSDESFAIEARAEIDRLDREAAELYNPDEHESLRARIAALEPNRRDGGQLEQASARRDAIERELVDLESRISGANGDLEDRTKAVAELDRAVAGLPASRDALQAAQRELDERRAEEGAGSAEAARLAERLEAARRAADERERAVEAERSAAAEHRSYRRLTEAFGTGGIPDLIIDNARPELEDDANTILGRLTDYEMSVQFVMQKETKSGKARETFDVLVHHDGGVRDFAMFSGGEAFRIAFAVRLALSKLLVRRAGARLETLVIDEGFGTQDPGGRERLIEAVSLAQAEFSMILVITHLDELKDLFGGRIEVSKDPEKGSVVRSLGA